MYTVLSSAKNTKANLFCHINRLLNLNFVMQACENHLVIKFLPKKLSTIEDAQWLGTAGITALHI